MSNKKRIIIVLGSLELGGSEKQALLLANYLIKEKKADVRVWGLNAEGRASDLCSEWNIPWKISPFHVDSNPITNLRSLIRFVFELRKERPDVILSYTWLPNILCGLTWKFSGAKLFIWNQRDEGLELVPKRAYHRLAARLTGFFISNSDHAKNYLVRNFNIQPDKIFVVHNGILLPDSASHDLTWLEALNIPQNCFLACMVANLNGNKDHVTLLKAWRIVVDNISKYGIFPNLLLAGRFDDMYPVLKKLVSDLDLIKNVTFLGKVHDVPDLLSAVDLCVHSSQHEGCPNGILESMAAGLAVVATDIPGIREAVGPESFQYLAPPGDAETFADLIIKLAFNHDLRKKIGASNYQRIKDEFSLMKMCEKTIKIYEGQM